MLYTNENILSGENKDIIIYEHKFKKKDDYKLVDPVEYIKNNTTGHEAFYGQCSAYFDFDGAVYGTSVEQVRNKHHDVRWAIENVCGFLEVEEHECVVFLAAGLKSDNDLSKDLSK